MIQVKLISDPINIQIMSSNLKHFKNNLVLFHISDIKLNLLSVVIIDNYDFCDSLFIHHSLVISWTAFVN